MAKPKPKSATVNVPFPVHALPRAVADICEEISNSFEVPLELPCTTALGLLAACCQKKAIVRAGRNYTEQLNLFTLAISDTGDRKSNVFKMLRDAVISAQNEYFMANEDKIAQSRLEYKLLQKRLDAASRDMISNDESDITLEYIKDLEKQIRNFELLSAPKLLMDDATSEKLIDVLEEQGGSIAIASPEGGLFSTLRTAASANPTFDAYLKAYTGDSIEIARISRKGNSIEAPKLSLIIACQPKTADAMIKNETFRDKGLPARFLFAKCRSLVGTRTFDKPDVSEGTIEAYNRLIHELLVDAFDKNIEQRELHLTENGRTAYIGFSTELESKIGDSGELSFMQDWCAKLPGQMLRIAGIISVCDGKQSIDSGSVNRASTIASWFMENAIVLFSEQAADTETIRFSRETLKRFLDETTVPDKKANVKTSKLYDYFKAWALEHGCESVSSQRFVGELKSMGVVASRQEGNVVKDIRIKA